MGATEAEMNVEAGGTRDGTAAQDAGVASAGLALAGRDGRVAFAVRGALRGVPPGCLAPEPQGRSMVASLECAAA